MHELSLATEICRIAEVHAGAAGAGRVTAVGVEIGDEAAVDAESLSFCLDVLLSQSPFVAARPRLHRSPGTDLWVSYVELNDGDPND